MADGIEGTQGYAREAAELIVRYEALSFSEAHSEVLHLLPAAPSTILDIGSGTGRDAAYLAAIGHEVVAIEPTDALRIAASQLHPNPSIEWIDDGLPHLARIADRREEFDLVMLNAVWMHLDLAGPPTSNAGHSLSAPSGRHHDHDAPPWYRARRTADVRSIR